jgi:NTP pyrophosphatase (non-canonical NTP hydrolase)
MTLDRDMLGNTYVVTDADMVAAFYYQKLRRLPTPHEAIMYLLEELSELAVALEDGALDSEILKELQDVKYTIAGYELARGWNGTEAFRRVHESNMTKEPTADGKVRKGAMYVAPNLDNLVRRAT